MSRMFGTDGVRGVAGAELTIELARFRRSRWLPRKGQIHM